MIGLRSSASVAFLFGLAIFAVSLAAERAWAQSNYDGAWSVLIVTETGECDRAYRYGIRIANGQIHYGGEAGVQFTGRVERNGQLTATVHRGQQSATGSGRLSGNSGAGTWRGRSDTGGCAGRWEAERR